MLRNLLNHLAKQPVNSKHANEKSSQRDKWKKKAENEN